MRFRRVTVVANIVIIGATLPTVGLSFSTTSQNGAAPLYEYDSAATGVWSTQGLTSDFAGHSIIGSAHGVTGEGEFALSARLENGHLGLYERNANATTSFYDVSNLTRAPQAASDPNVFIDPAGNIDLIYVSTKGRLILVSPRTVLAPRAEIAPSRVSSHVTSVSHVLAPGGLRPITSRFTITDLTASSHIPMTPGLVSVSVSGRSAEIFDRSTNGDAVVLPLHWRQLNSPPSLGASTDVTAMTNSPTLMNTPVALPGITNAFAATTTAGHVEFFSQIIAGTGAWTVTDVSDVSASPPSTGQLAIAANGLTTYVASLSSANHVQLFSTSTPSSTTGTTTTTGTSTTTTSGTSTTTGSTTTSSTTSTTTSTTTTTLTSGKTRAQSVRASVAAHVTTPPASWKYRDLTAVIAGSPVWTGNIFLSATATSINVAGRAANWGDIYDYTEKLPAITWTSNDVSLSTRGEKL